MQEGGQEGGDDGSLLADVAAASRVKINGWQPRSLVRWCGEQQQAREVIVYAWPVVLEAADCVTKEGMMKREQSVLCVDKSREGQSRQRDTAGHNSKAN